MSAQDLELHELYAQSKTPCEVLIVDISHFYPVISALQCKAMFRTYARHTTSPNVHDAGGYFGINAWKYLAASGSPARQPPWPAADFRPRVSRYPHHYSPGASTLREAPGNDRRLRVPPGRLGCRRNRNPVLRDRCRRLGEYARCDPPLGRGC